jgi:dUTP pyrophosphatase
MKIKLLNGRARMPRFHTPQSAGFDLHYNGVLNVILEPGETVTLGTGLAMEIPPGFSGLVCSRSGMARHNGVIVLNAPGIIDADYRGEIAVILHNTSQDIEYTVEPGERIAQMVIVRYEQPHFELAEDLSETDRAESGFGSTGRG